MGNNDKIKAIDTTKFGSLQKCPYQKSVLVWAFRLGRMVFGTVGLIFLNIWAAVMYLLLINDNSLLTTTRIPGQHRPTVGQR